MTHSYAWRPGKGDMLWPDDPREGYLACGRAPEQLRVYCRVEQCSQSREVALDRRWRGLAGSLIDCDLELGRSQACQGPLAQGAEEHAYTLAVSGDTRPTLARKAQPVLRPVFEGDAARSVIEVLAPEHVGLDGCQECVRVRLGRERGRSRDPLSGSVSVANPPPARGSPVDGSELALGRGHDVVPQRALSTRLDSR